MISEKALRIVYDAQKRVIERNNPLLETLPEWVKGWRPAQVDAIKKIIAAFDEVDVVVLDAPTGTGKTLIAESVRRLMNVDALYVCNSKHLQDQFAEDYNYANVLKGRSNYTPTSAAGEWELATCADCSRDKCTLCADIASCPYTLAKERALTSPLAVVNTAYALREWSGQYSSFSGRGLVIMDEADTLEKELMNYVQVEITAGRCRKYGLREPDKVTVASSWGEWFDYAIKRLGGKRDQLHGDSLQSTRERSYLTRLLANLRRIAPDIEDGWVYTGKNGAVSFKPVRVDAVGRGALWKHGRKFLLMSATIVSAGSLMESLGGGTFCSINVPSSWPIENRRIKVLPAANMSRKADADGSQSQTLARALLSIIVRHRSEHMLVHCVSYQLAQYLHGELDGRCRALGVECSTYTGSDGKSDALARFREPGGHVLFAPSMDRGVDLPDDLCRVIVIAKMPYPYLGDRQVSARMHSKGGQVWYNIQTVRSVIQMTGRGVRHKDDWCVSYVLDSQFEALWGRARSLFPQWWTEALQWS